MKQTKLFSCLKSARGERYSQGSFAVFFDKDNETEEQKENNFGKSSADSRCMCMSWYSTPRHESHPCVLQIYQ